MRHDSLPQTMTPENLADYIRTNKVDIVNHVEKILLTEEEIKQLAMDSSLASRQIDKLEEVKKYFDLNLKKGTPWNSATSDHNPLSVTIPPTKGIDKLKENRKFADDRIRDGYKEEVTPVYFLPWPERERILAVDIEGNEWSTYSRAMSLDEIKQHGKPVLKSIGQKFRDDLAKSGMRVEGVEGDTLVISTGHDKVDDDKEETDLDL